MSRLLLALLFLTLGGCATLSSTWSQLTAARELEPSWDCGEPAADAASHPPLGESPAGGDDGQP
jgi:hypothetical protein